MLSSSIEKSEMCHENLKKIYSSGLERDMININEKWLDNFKFSFSIYSNEKENQPLLSFSPLIICKNDKLFLEDICHKMTKILEKLIDKYVMGDPELNEYFKDYNIFKPFFKKVAGKWLQITRYDFIIDCNHNIKFTEFNTSSPGSALLFSEGDNAILKFINNKKINTENFSLQEYSKRNFFENHILHLIKFYKAEKDSIAILYDSHKLNLDLYEMKRRLDNAKINACVGSVEDLNYINNEVFLNGNRASLIYNNFFIHGKNKDLNQDSPWFSHKKNLFDKNPYNALFKGLNNNSCTLIIGFPSLTICEDKSIFSLLRDKKFSYLFSDEEINFIEKYIPETISLADNFSGVNEESNIVKNKNKLVIKKRKSGMGLGVYIGKEHSNTDWITIIKDNLNNAIVQEYIKSYLYPALIVSKNKKIITDDMNGIIGMYSYDGKYRGCMSRISSHSIANLIRGFLQPVLEEN